MSDHNFNTPPELLAKVRLLDPKCGIGLDPCSNQRSLVDARRVFCGTGSASDDGLAQPWRGHGLVFMNPPHSMSPNNIEPWMLKAHNEFRPLNLAWGARRFDGYHDQFVGLIPAKTDTAWFHDYVTTFQVRVFLRGRPRFWLNGAPMPGPGKFASMLIYAGKQPELFKSIFGEMGWVV
jgi:DNA N-6-adenine-methyltransferase (Dam)